MIIDYKDYTSIDYTRYKRVFIFGCSFTHYKWPTWAEILVHEMPNAKSYNFGASGGGNLYISERIIAANQKYCFNEEDLILVMWSTYMREDRYKNKKWITPGNIFTQNIISEDFVKEWACVRGYVVRDLALMTMIKNTLKILPCHSVILQSVDAEYDALNTDAINEVQDVIKLYKSTIDDLPVSLNHVVGINHGTWTTWGFGHEYYWPESRTQKLSEKHKDRHPNPKMYLDYLLKIGFKISENTQNKIHALTEELLSIETHDEIIKWFTNLRDNYPNYYYSPLYLI